MLKMGNRDEREVGMGYINSSSDSGSIIQETRTSEGQTIIGEHISIEGTIRADEDIIIEGNMKGTIEVKAHQLTVGAKGQVEADVDADSVVISGRMVGNINARNKVHVTKNADFNGQIKARRIAVEDGAFIKASIELERDDKKAAAQGVKRPIEAMEFVTDKQKTDIPKTGTTNNTPVAK